MGWQDEEISKNNFDGHKLETDIRRWDIICSKFIMFLLNPFLVVTVLSASCILAVQTNIGLFPRVMAFLLLLFLNVFFFFLINTLNAFFSSKIKLGILGKHMFTFTDEGLIEETAFNHALHKWCSLDRVVAILGYVVVRVSGQNWHVFPSRCFVNEQDKQSFILELKRRINI